LILLITSLAFTTFAIGLAGPQNRCTIVGILLLTLINFRLVLTQRLPSVSYLTLLDKYSICCIMLLASLLSWDAIIGSFIISSDVSYLKSIEANAVYGFCGGFLFFLVCVILYSIKLLISIKFFEKSNLKAYLKKKNNKTTYIRAIN
jgi:hypothetical protein